MYIFSEYMCVHAHYTFYHNLSTDCFNVLSLEGAMNAAIFWSFCCLDTLCTSEFWAKSTDLL